MEKPYIKAEVVAHDEDGDVVRFSSKLFAIDHNYSAAFWIAEELGRAAKELGYTD